MTHEERVHVATFCGNCSCGCPELYVDPAAPADRRIVITDDFGQEIRMSAAQFGAWSSRNLRMTRPGRLSISPPIDRF